MIRITSKTEGFRRCGIAHSTEPTEYPDDKFTPAQLQILRAEKMLIVEVGPDKAPEDGGGNQLNANKTIELVVAAQTVEELDKLAAGEERKSVVAAIDKRRKELAG